MYTAPWAPILVCAPVWHVHWWVHHWHHCRVHPPSRRCHRALLGLLAVQYGHPFVVVEQLPLCPCTRMSVYPDVCIPGCVDFTEFWHENPVKTPIKRGLLRCHLEVPKVVPKVVHWCGHRSVVVVTDPWLVDPCQNPIKTRGEQSNTTVLHPFTPFYPWIQDP